jgi:Ca-activated chloride channel homolog
MVGIWRCYLENTLTLKADFDRALAWEAGDSVRYVVADVQAPEWVPAAERTPLNLALVIDRSGSMSGAPLDAAKKAASDIVGRLAAEDRISIVSFDDNVSIHADGVPVGGNQKRIQKEIARIETLGSTNLSAGWLTGAECLAKVAAKETGLRSHVVVLSDGHANQGMVEPELLEHQASQLRNQGITTSAVGIGDGYSTTQLLAIANHGGGRLHDAEYTTEIVEVVLAELDALNTITADDVHLFVEHDPALRVGLVGPFPEVTSPGCVKAALGGIIGPQAGHAHEGIGLRHVVFRVKLPKGTAGTAFTLKLRAEWKRPGETEVHTALAEATVTLATDKDNSAQQRHAERSVIVARTWQSAIVRKVVDLNREGDFAATKRYIEEQGAYLTLYCTGLPGLEELQETLERLSFAARFDMGERNRKEMHLANYLADRTEQDSRLAYKRAPWQSYIPKPPQDPKLRNK